MANDDPTSLRMGFGYEDARASGVVGFKKPLEGRFYDFVLAERAAEKEISDLARRHPSLKARFAQIAREQVAQKYHRVQDILVLIKREIELHSPPGPPAAPQSN